MGRRFETCKRRAEALRSETYALYLACRDTRTPWYARAFGGMIVAYALSPVDLIPDFIPILGYLDDLVLVPLGTVLLLKMIPEQVLIDSRILARQVFREAGPRSRKAMYVVIAVWAIAIPVLVCFLSRWCGRFGWW